MNNTKFGKLIGVLDVGNSYCKFLIFSLKNREIITCSDIKLNKVESNDDDEYDPVELWNAVQDVINNVMTNLKILEINTNEIVCIGLTNQRETSLLWNKKSGRTFNLLSFDWFDKENLLPVQNAILSRIRNKKNYLRGVCGLPLDICFSAIKIKWLIENNKEVSESISKNECLFGNLDAWILWNLTGGIESGIHCTDVTNASRTLLMNLETLEWDMRLCKFFDIPPHILPKIRSCSEIYGYVKMSGSSLEGIPIASCIANTNSSLLGQLCMSAGQIECHIENDLSVMMNTGQEIIHSENLLTTVGFKLGPNEKAFYALEGFIGASTSGHEWLKDSINESNNNLSDNVSPVSSFISMRNGNCYKKLHDNEVIFVPALKGLCYPNFLYQAKGFLSGLTINTSSHQLFTAAKESICFQTKTILESLKKDCKTWPAINRLLIGGDFCENVDFLQLLADLCNLTIERPQISPPASLGCMLSAAFTMKCISLEDFKNINMPPTDCYFPTVASDVSDQRYVNWLTGIKTNLYINKENQREEVNEIMDSKQAQKFIMNSLPGTLFLFSSYIIYVLSQELMKF